MEESFINFISVETEKYELLRIKRNNSIKDGERRKQRMRNKTLLALICALFSIMFAANLTSSAIAYPLGDVNQDWKVDLDDLIIWAAAFGSTSADLTGSWDPRADLFADNVINIFDGIVIAQNYGFNST